MVWVIAVLGPTAVGKTEVGIELAERLGGEVVNGDALQVYRGFDIGTAKPSAGQRRRVRHHLLDVLAPEQRHSAGAFVRRAHTAVADIAARGRVPIVVGGSGLYLRALLEGLSPIPPVDDALRDRLRQRLEHDGLPALWARLSACDAATAAKLAATDRQRILRALEVFESTGRPLSYWHEQAPQTPRLQAYRLGLTLPRAILYDRVACRVRGMVASGWVAEVKGLLARGVDRQAPAFQAIGYRQLADHVLGFLSLEEAVAQTIRATRRYAKRQLTWFRREHRVEWWDASTLAQSMDTLVRCLEARRRKTDK